MKQLTDPMKKALELMATGLQINGNIIHDGVRRHALNYNTVKGLHTRGLIDHVRNHVWGTQYSPDGSKIIHEYTNPVYSISESGKEALAQSQGATQ